MKLDSLDYEIVAMITRSPGISIVSAARELGVARATVQARLDKLHAAGAITAIEPRLDPAAFGYPVTAICELEIEQGSGRDALFADLIGIPEIIDVYTVSGDADVMVRIVAASNSDLQRVFDHIAAISTVQRSRSSIVLTTHVEGKVLPLFEVASGAAG